MVKWKRKVSSRINSGQTTCFEGIRSRAGSEWMELSWVASGSAAAAFSLFPVTVDQLMAIADAGEIMPPKSTWFEPKLRSGLVIQTF